MAEVQALELYDLVISASLGFGSIGKLVFAEHMGLLIYSYARPALPKASFA